MLTPFDYLSTVSGGGYLGGWLSAWIKNAGDAAAVSRGLNKDLRTSDDAKRDPESEPIRHLRRYSNYLTPRFGFFSSDTWTLVATVLRNIFLNWLMLIPIIAAVLMIPRLVVSLATRESASLGVIAYVLGLGLFYMLISTLYSALDLPGWRKIGRGAETRDSKVTDGGFAWFCLIPLLFSALLLVLGWFWFVGSFPDDALRFARWNSPTGAWCFVYALMAASFPGGIIVVILRKRRLLDTWREPLAMGTTTLAGGAGLWWVLELAFSGSRSLPVRRAGDQLPVLCAFARAPGFPRHELHLRGHLQSEHDDGRPRVVGSLRRLVLVTALAWAIASAVVLWGPIGIQVLLQDRSWIKTVVTALGGATGIATALLGYSARSAAAKKEGARSGSGSRSARLFSSFFSWLISPSRPPGWRQSFLE